MPKNRIVLCGQLPGPAEFRRWNARSWDSMLAGANGGRAREELIRSGVPADRIVHLGPNLAAPLLRIADDAAEIYLASLESEPVLDDLAPLEPAARKFVFFLAFVFDLGVRYVLSLRSALPDNKGPYRVWLLEGLDEDMSPLGVRAWRSAKSNVVARLWVAGYGTHGPAVERDDADFLVAVAMGESRDAAGSDLARRMRLQHIGVIHGPAPTINIPVLTVATRTSLLIAARAIAEDIVENGLCALLRLVDDTALRQELDTSSGEIRYAWMRLVLEKAGWRVLQRLGHSSLTSTNPIQTMWAMDSHVASQIAREWATDVAT